MKVSDLPKAELHAHLSGSVPTQIIEKLCAEFELDIPEDFNLPSDLQVLKPVNTMLEYFKPWFILKKLPMGRNCLSTMVDATIRAAAVDNVKYLELRHSITTMSKNNKIENAEAIEWMLDELAKASIKYEVDCRLIVSISRYKLESKAAWDLVSSIKSVNYHRRVVGVDLTGNEDEAIPHDICDVLRIAKEDLGLGITVHAGETGKPENIRWAIEKCGATRIGHGLAATEDKNLLEYMCKRNICLEICLTSNLRTSRVVSMKEHPLHNFIKVGVPFVLCSDNPAIHQAPLSSEYSLFLEEFGHAELLMQMYASQIRYSFGNVEHYV